MSGLGVIWSLGGCPWCENVGCITYVVGMMTVGIGPGEYPNGWAGVCGVCGREGPGVLGGRGVNGLALGLYTNSFAFGLRVDFFKALEASSAELLLGGDLPLPHGSRGGDSCLSSCCCCCCWSSSPTNFKLVLNSFSSATSSDRGFRGGGGGWNGNRLLLGWNARGA